MDAHWLTRQLNTFDAPEACEAIERIVLSIPDACQDRYVELLDDEFDELAWSPVSARWVSLVFLGILMMTHVAVVVGELIILEYLGRDVPLFVLPSNASVSFYSAGLTCVAALITKRVADKADQSSWASQVIAGRKYDKEYLVLEAARRAKDGLFKEIGLEQ